MVATPFKYCPLRKNLSINSSTILLISLINVCTAQAGNTIISHNKVNVLGDDNLVEYSPWSNITGNNNTVKDVSPGHNNESGDASSILGNHNTITAGTENTAIGNGNTINGNDKTAHGIVIGTNSKLESSTNGISIGTQTQATGENSISMGTNASASNGGIAIGANSTAQGGEVSFGSDKEKRRLTNISAGESGTDATNVNQLNDKARETLNAANSYTEQKANEALDAAKNHTNSKVADTKNELNTNINSAKNEAIDSSNHYTDSKITDTKNELNTKINHSKDEAISTSNHYTDEKYQQGISYTNKKYEQSINYAQNAANDAEKNANHYTDNRINQLSRESNSRFSALNNRIETAERRLNAAIAGVTAIASIPYVAENNFSYGIGLGNYQNGNAVAAGMQYKTSLNTNIKINISWDSFSNTALGVGFAGGW